ncbi:MAG: hypothetical protein ABI417_12000, partial [Coleofasciculaceae cyanobacterium]
AVPVAFGATEAAVVELSATLAVVVGATKMSVDANSDDSDLEEAVVELFATGLAVVGVTGAISKTGVDANSDCLIGVSAPAGSELLAIVKAVMPKSKETFFNERLFTVTPHE